MIANVLRPVRRALGFAAALFLAQPALAAPQLEKREGVWAQTYTGVAADPAVTFGQLPNGLRYAVMRNAKPVGTVAMRLVILSGSLAEADDQRGLAHLLEHMAFRGSAQVPDGEMVRLLQRRGLTFGADTNAATSYTATTYRLDFPRNDADSLATGLMLFREIASNLTLDERTLDRERQVVLAEERERDNPLYRAGQAELAAMLPGQRAAQRSPIGTRAIVGRVAAAPLRDFYETHYRPDNAVLIIVGDVDAAETVKAIADKFGDWEPKRPGALPRPATGRPQSRGETVKLYSAPGAAPVTHLSWVRPYDNRADDAARERRDWVRVLGVIMFNQRLADLARRPGAAFLGASLSRQNLLESADVTTLRVNAPPEQRIAALTAALAEQKRAATFGFTQVELDRALANQRAGWEAAVAGTGARPSPVLANRLAAAAYSNDVFNSPVQDYAAFLTVTPTITLAEIRDAFRDAFIGGGPVLFAGGPQPAPGGEAGLRRALSGALRAPAARGIATAAVTWPYTSFGPAGSVAARTQIADLNITQIRFANNVRLTVKPTRFVRDEVFVRVRFGTGRLGLPLDRVKSFWTVTGGQLLVEGGLGKLDLPAIQQALSGKLLSVNYGMEGDAVTLTGRTRATDLPAQFQLLTAYLTDPAFRPDAFRRLQQSVRQSLPVLRSLPQAVAGRALPPLLVGGDRRWEGLTRDDYVDAASPADAPALLRLQLAGPVEITVVGDVDLDAVARLAATTFGTLTPRPVAGPVTEDVHFTAPPTPVTLRHRGRADQALALQFWRGPSVLRSPADARAMSLAVAIIRSRLIDRLRTLDGVSYSPSAGSESSKVLPDYGLVNAGLELSPDKVPLFHRELAAIVADLARVQVSADEFARAKGPALEARRRTVNENGYWLNELDNSAREPRTFDVIRSYLKQFEALQPADVQRVVATYLAGQPALQVAVLPEAAPAAK